jgi:hypothetical protein
LHGAPKLAGDVEEKRIRRGGSRRGKFAYGE